VVTAGHGGHALVTLRDTVTTLADSRPVPGHHKPRHPRMTHAVNGEKHAETPAFPYRALDRERLDGTRGALRRRAVATVATPWPQRKTQRKTRDRARGNAKHQLLRFAEALNACKSANEEGNGGPSRGKKRPQCPLSTFTRAYPYIHIHTLFLSSQLQNSPVTIGIAAVRDSQ
jgi:hypothetical protein